MIVSSPGAFHFGNFFKVSYLSAGVVKVLFRACVEFMKWILLDTSGR